ncbi:MAG: CDP-alcohol phosphatidyltransferase family protein, partial [Pseudomonadales bacterium]|nr:CDP-alcohol phosphatidyltransferase family protein [Pseudomonadales bacterium]
ALTLLDRFLHPLVKPALKVLAGQLAERKISADQVTVAGFLLGLLAVPFIIVNWYSVALVLIVLNRLSDGIDGELARLTLPTDAGGFLDITLDFIFYQAVVFGFALAAPANTFWALLLMLSFVGTGVSFLSFAIMAEKRQIKSVHYPNKALHYLDGLAEGTETIAIFLAFCLWPDYFPWLAGSFAVVCLITTVSRILQSYRILTEEAAVR